jgi:hypothetical protein
MMESLFQGKSDPATVVRKMFVDQLTYGPTCTLVFMVRPAAAAATPRPLPCTQPAWPPPAACTQAPPKLRLLAPSPRPPAPGRWHVQQSARRCPEPKCSRAAACLPTRRRKPPLPAADLHLAGPGAQQLGRHQAAPGQRLLAQPKVRLAALAPRLAHQLPLCAAAVQGALHQPGVPGLVHLPAVEDDAGTQAQHQLIRAQLGSAPLGGWAAAGGRGPGNVGDDCRAGHRATVCARGGAARVLRLSGALERSSSSRGAAAQARAGAGAPRA